MPSETSTLSTKPSNVDRIFQWHAKQELDASGRKPVFTEPPRKSK